MHELMIFEGHEVEVFELNGAVLFNPYHVGECLEMAPGTVKDHMSKMNKKQVVKVKNSDVGLTNFRKLNNAGENFLTESGVYKLVFKSRKPNAEAFTDWVTDEVLPTLRETGSYEMPKAKKNKSNRTALSSANMMVKNVMSVLEKAKVEPVFIAAEVKRLYTDLGYEVKAPLITDKETMPKLYDCTEIARELGIYSTNNNPHNQAVSVIIKKLHIPDSEIITTAFSRNGHDDVTIQYKPSVLKDMRSWLAENNYPTRIPYENSKGNQKVCTVVYRNAGRD
ncbi:BRO-N domain-containing protein [Enterocloster alcoholdehydrogenati]|uniref:BRO-N domain-containing protein n=1 Tax=Enterocloster alcoholdehydrogenati TaxID=2547410 RepID=UPI001FAB4401|nr:BRO family protein [Enterocloster alcoholdehydrogenati]